MPVPWQGPYSPEWYAKQNVLAGTKWAEEQAAKAAAAKMGFFDTVADYWNRITKGVPSDRFLQSLPGITPEDIAKLKKLPEFQERGPAATLWDDLTLNPFGADGRKSIADALSGWFDYLTKGLGTPGKSVFAFMVLGAFAIIALLFLTAVASLTGTVLPRSSGARRRRTSASSGGGSGVVAGVVVVVVAIYLWVQYRTVSHSITFDADAPVVEPEATLPADAVETWNQNAGAMNMLEFLTGARIPTIPTEG